MLISSNIDVLAGLLEEFKPCFSKPQFQNFSKYTLELIACEGKKTVDTINRNFMNAKDQSSLNRFPTQSPWNLQKLEEKRLSLAQTRLPAEEGSRDFGRCLPLCEASMLPKACRLDLQEVQTSS